VLPVQKHDWNWSVKYFILRMRFSKTSIFKMVLKRLKLHQFLMVWHELFPTHKHGCRNGGRNLKISARLAVFLVSSGKIKFHHFWSPLEKPLEKYTGAPLEHSFQRPCIAKFHHFCKKCVVFHHLATLFNNTNAASKP